MTAKDRLRQFAGEMNLSMRQLCIKAGIDEGYYKTFSGNPRPSIVKALQRTYPQLNIDWLCTGEGSMFIDGAESSVRIINTQSKITGDNSGNVAGGNITFTDSESIMNEKIAALEKENARLQAQVETLQGLTDKLLGMLNK